jgi:DNA-directed RNA polymerase sigma subunit (sigma70/sigma32)
MRKHDAWRPKQEANEAPYVTQPTGKLDQALRGLDANAALAGLPERDQTVLEMRYGLLNGSPMTLSAIGREIGYSPENIRHIEIRGLRRAAMLRDEVIPEKALEKINDDSEQGWHWSADPQEIYWNRWHKDK